MFGVALDGHHVKGFRLVRMNIDGESEVGGQIAADLLPGLPGIFAAHHIPVLLHVQHVGARAVHREAVNAVADLSRGIGNVLRTEAAVDWLPRLAAVVGAKRACRRDCDENPVRIARIDQDCVQAHATGSGRPMGS